MPGGGAKHWCMTINNPTEKEWKKWFFDTDKNKLMDDIYYFMNGFEIGDEEEVDHFQMYLCYKERMTFSKVKKMFPRAHIEMTNGTPQEASEYCTKQGNYVELGIVPEEKGSAGGKKRMERYRNAIECAKKQRIEGLIETDPDIFLLHYRTLKQIQKDYPAQIEDIDEVCGEWYHGEPGCGKTHKAYKENPGHYKKPLSKWWDGYRGEDVVVLDDVGKTHAQWIGEFLKHWADKYSFPAENKFGAMLIRPKKVIVTSNYTIDELFEDEMLAKALKRRFKVQRIVRAM